LSGPFANMTINLGPVAPLPGTAPGPDGGLGYNPRRLKRDVGPAIIQRYANYTTILGTLASYDRGTITFGLGFRVLKRLLWQTCSPSQHSPGIECFRRAYRIRKRLGHMAGVISA